MEKQALIIFEKFGSQNLGQAVRLNLFQLLTDSYSKKSIINTFELSVAKWHENINDPILTNAMLERLIANTHRKELKGESLCRKKMKTNH